MFRNRLHGLLGIIETQMRQCGEIKSSFVQSGVSLVYKMTVQNPFAEEDAAGLVGGISQTSSP